MKILSFILLIFLLYSCHNNDKAVHANQYSKKSSAISLSLAAAKQRKLSKYEAAILKELDMIDSLSSYSFTEGMDIDTVYKDIDTCNQGIFNTLTKLSQDGMQFLNFKLNDERFKYLISSDKKFCLISWMPTEGGTWDDFTNVAIYSNGQQPRIKWLRDTSDGNEGQAADMDILFDTLVTIYTNSGKAIYLAYGSGQAQGISPLKAITAFSIEDSLRRPAIFPEGNENLLCYELNDDIDQAYMDIKFLDKGRRLLVPIIKNGMPSCKFRKLVFDGERYKEVH